MQLNTLWHSTQMLPLPSIQITALISVGRITPCTKNIHQKYQRYYRPRKISWYFNTPLASPQGGAWKCLIHSVRRLLSHLPLDPQKLPVSTDVLRTMLAGAQKIINARPLTPVRASPEDCDAVTSSSLLHHKSVRPTNPIGTLLTRENLLRDHRHAQEGVDAFWEKRGQLYLHYLHKRHRQQIKHKKFQVGDLVLLVDHPTARAQYPLARVGELHPSVSGITRRVHVMTANADKLNPHLPCKRTYLDRDSTKIALVEFPSVNPLSQGFYFNPSGNNV